MSTGRMGRASWAALACLLVAGCGGGGQDGAPTFVGKVTDTGQDAVIGAVSDGANVSFYVCGGDTTYATMTRWMQGTAAADGALDVTSDGWHVTGNLEKGSGQLTTAQGTTLSWTVHPASGDLEGLYQATDGGCRTGAVVGDFGDGKGTRLQGTWCDLGNLYAQVTPIKAPLRVVDKTIEVSVQMVNTRTLVVTRLLAPLPPP